jgi:hypothetical protein
MCGNGRLGSLSFFPHSNLLIEAQRPHYLNSCKNIVDNIRILSTVLRYAAESSVCCYSV